jgi:hypothetical protein
LGFQKKEEEEEEEEKLGLLVLIYIVLNGKIYMKLRVYKDFKDVVMVKFK